MPEMNIAQNTTFQQIRNQFAGVAADKHIRGGVNRLYTNAKSSWQSVQITTGLFKVGGAVQSRAAERQAGADNVKRLLDAEFGAHTGDRVFTLVGKETGHDLRREVTRGDLDVMTGILDATKANTPQRAAKFKDVLDKLYGTGMGASLFFLVGKEKGHDLNKGLRAEDLAAVRARMDTIEAAPDPATAVRAVAAEVTKVMAKSEVIGDFLRSDSDGYRGLQALIKPHAESFFGPVAKTVRDHLAQKETFTGQRSNLPNDEDKKAGNIQRARIAHEIAMQELIGGKEDFQIANAVEKVPQGLLRMYAAIAASAYQGAKENNASDEEAKRYADIAVSNFFALRFMNPLIVTPSIEGKSTSQVTTAALVQSTFNKQDPNAYPDFHETLRGWHTPVDKFIDAMIKRGRGLNNPELVEQPAQAPQPIPQQIVLPVQQQPVVQVVQNPPVALQPVQVQAREPLGTPRVVVEENFVARDTRIDRRLRDVPPPVTVPTAPIANPARVQPVQATLNRVTPPRRNQPSAVNSPLPPNSGLASNKLWQSRVNAVNKPK
jgi:hypothetical protein